jgi:uncharacterized membrane protein (DUF2068 family)
VSPGAATDEERPIATREPGDVTLWLIGGFKLVKGLILVAAGVGVLGLLHQDFAEFIASWAMQLHEHRHLNRALSKVLSLDPGKLRAISAGTFFYAALLLTEGVGLLLRKRWAEYFTVFVTTSFIPLELYELAKHITVTRVIVVVINVAIVWYLLTRLFRRRRPG